ncbi:unnamed protein product [marine sediment metagenome]|uniref:Uncharacterized protein n=1 Tax=marine sediment metagenome TaxID=412755 RepID=X1AHT4_9ZZZZ
MIKGFTIIRRLETKLYFYVLAKKKSGFFAISNLKSGEKKNGKKIKNAIQKISLKSIDFVEKLGDKDFGDTIATLASWDERNKTIPNFRKIFNLQKRIWSKY